MAAADTATTERRAGLGWRVAGTLLRRREASISIVALGLILYFYAKNSVFLESDNIKNITESMAPIALIAAGEVMLLICGEIDLAVGRVFAFAPALVWWLCDPDKHGLSLWLGVPIALAASCAVGLASGVITTYLRVPSFITTLGMLFFLNGVTLHLMAGSQQFMPGGENFKNVFGSQPESYKLWLNSEFFWVLGLVLVVQGILTWTRWGLWTFATGGNLTGAAESGVNVRWIKIGNFVLANFLAGFAGILDSTRITTIVPLQGGPDIMFLAVAGAVIGGTSLFGGQGTVIGSFIGVLAILAAMIVNVQVARLRNLGRLQ
jgi:simple sugar transport system permease protein